MNGKNLFRALEYVDDRYLDMVDAAAQEATDMKQKHFSGKKTILYILAAAICVSLFTVTAAAAGWIPNIFAAAQPKATPRDEPVLEAAQSATQSQTPETVEFAEADYTKFTLFQSYYDGKSIALGYDLSGVMPGETVVGFTPEDALKQEILQRPDNQFWCERYGLTDDTADQYLEAGVWTQEEYDQRLAGRSERAKKYDLRRDSQIYMDDQLRALLTDGEYKKFWEILGETGSCCVAIPMKPYVGDHILLNGADEPADRGDYTTEEGECLVLNNLPAAAQNQPSITVGLKFKSGWSYYYMELSGNQLPPLRPESGLRYDHHAGKRKQTIILRGSCCVAAPLYSYKTLKSVLLGRGLRPAATAAKERSQYISTAAQAVCRETAFIK